MLKTSLILMLAGLSANFIAADRVFAQESNAKARLEAERERQIAQEAQKLAEVERARALQAMEVAEKQRQLAEHERAMAEKLRAEAIQQAQMAEKALAAEAAARKEAELAKQALLETLEKAKAETQRNQAEASRQEAIEALARAEAEVQRNAALRAEIEALAQKRGQPADREPRKSRRSRRRNPAPDLSRQVEHLEAEVRQMRAELETLRNLLLEDRPLKKSQPEASFDKLPRPKDKAPGIEGVREKLEEARKDFGIKGPAGDFQKQLQNLVRAEEAQIGEPCQELKRQNEELRRHLEQVLREVEAARDRELGARKKLVR